MFHHVLGMQERGDIGMCGDNPKISGDVKVLKIEDPAPNIKYIKNTTNSKYK